MCKTGTSRHLLIFFFALLALVACSKEQTPELAESGVLSVLDTEGSVTGDKVVSDTDIDCDGATTVTLTLEGMSGIAGNPADILLVLDRSGSMAGSALANLKTAANNFIDLIDEQTDGALDGTVGNGSRLGVVSFASGAVLEASLSAGPTGPIKTTISGLVAGGATNHSAAIATAQSELAGSVPGNSKVMIVFTDGNPNPASNDGVAEAAAARATGTEIFAIGLTGQGGLNVGLLNAWATNPDATHVFTTTSEDDLDAIFQAIGTAITVAAGTNITIVDTVNAHFSVSDVVASTGAAALVGNVLTWTIDELFTETATLSYTATHDPTQAGGVEAVNVSVSYSDDEGNVVVFPSPTVNVRGCPATIDLDPDTEVNELGTPGQTHTVTATVSDDFGDPVENVSVSFTILSGPNAGATDNGVTDAAGMTDLSYEAVQGLAGLGQDSIQGCFTNNAGDDVCDTVTKDWVDTTPPVAACEEGVNPAGKVPPPNNEDGFFLLVAEDAVDPDPQIFVDAGDGVVFGGFPSGTNIKYTEAPGAKPKIKNGPGQVDYHIIGNQDMVIYSVDASGNASDPLTCLVPPPPK